MSRCPNCNKIECNGILFQSEHSVSLILESEPEITVVCEGKREILKDCDDRPYFILTFAHGMNNRIPLKRISKFSNGLPAVGSCPPMPKVKHPRVDMSNLSRLYHALADSMEWMLKDLIFRAEATDLPTCQSDEMKLALNAYRDLCMLIGKDPALL